MDNHFHENRYVLLWAIIISFTLESIRHLYQNQNPYYILALALIGVLFLITVFGFNRNFPAQVFTTSLCFLALFVVTALNYKSILYVDMYLLQGTFLASLIVSYRYIVGVWLVILPTLLFILRDEKIYPGQYWSDVSIHFAGMCVGILICEIIYRQYHGMLLTNKVLNASLDNLKKSHINAYKSLMQSETDGEILATKMRLYSFSIASQLDEIVSSLNEQKSENKPSDLALIKTENLMAAASALSDQNDYISMQLEKMPLGNVLKRFNAIHNSGGNTAIFKYDTTCVSEDEILLPINAIDTLLHHLKNHLIDKYDPDTVTISVQLGRGTETLQSIQVSAILPLIPGIDQQHVNQFNRMMESNDYFYGDQNHAQMIKYCLRKIRGYSHVSFERRKIKYEINFWINKVSS